MTDRCLLTSIFKIYIKFPFSWYIICLVPKVSNNFNLSHGQYSSSFLWPNVSNFDNIYFTFIVILLTVTMTHWRNFKEKSRRNFKETPGNNIPRERICFNERDTNRLVTAKRTEKVWGKRKRREDTIISSTVVNEEYLRRRSIQKKRWWYHLQNLQCYVERTDGKCGDWVQRDIAYEYICPKSYGKRDIYTNYDFL